MKICLLQCDVCNGDLAGNVEKIIQLAENAAASGAELCIVPTHAIYGPESAFYLAHDDFRASFHTACACLAKRLPVPLLCGMETGAILFSGGVFVETAKELFFRGNIIATGSDPNDDLPAADMFIHLAPRRFEPGGQQKFEDMLAAVARQNNMWAVAPNLCGGYGSQIFNGQSVVYTPQGRLYARGPAFAPGLIQLDTDRDSGEILPTCASVEDEQWRALVLGLGDYCHKAGVKKAVLGLSGGMDSALVACIACAALGSANVTGILMPSPFTSQASLTDACELAQNLEMPTLTLPIEPLMTAFKDCLAPVLEKFSAQANDLTFENLQARIRGILLMATANRSGALVLNTGNKSELAMGYNTLYGDTAGAIAVIGDLLKTRVYELARWYCEKAGEMIIPQNVFDKAPSAELRPNQKDTDSLPPYDRLDAILHNLLSHYATTSGEMAKEADAIQKKILSFQFKRAQCPPPLLVSGQPLEFFGGPIDGRYNPMSDCAEGK